MTYLKPSASTFIIIVVKRGHCHLISPSLLLKTKIIRFFDILLYKGRTRWGVRSPIVQAEDREFWGILKRSANRASLLSASGLAVVIVCPRTAHTSSWASCAAPD